MPGAGSADANGPHYPRNTAEPYDRTYQEWGYLRAFSYPCSSHVDEHRQEPGGGSPSLNGGPGERTHRFVRWTLAQGRWLWLAALVLLMPSTVALVRLYRHLTSEIEELLPRDAPSVTAIEELRQR